MNKHKLYELLYFEITMRAFVATHMFPIKCNVPYYDHALYTTSFVTACNS